MLLQEELLGEDDIVFAPLEPVLMQDNRTLVTCHFMVDGHGEKANVLRACVVDADAWRIVYEVDLHAEDNVLSFGMRQQENGVDTVAAVGEQHGDDWTGKRLFVHGTQFPNRYLELVHITNGRLLNGLVSPNIKRTIEGCKVFGVHPVDVTFLMLTCTVGHHGLVTCERIDTITCAPAAWYIQGSDSGDFVFIMPTDDTLPMEMWSIHHPDAPIAYLDAPNREMFDAVFVDDILLGPEEYADERPVRVLAQKKDGAEYNVITTWEVPTTLPSAHPAIYECTHVLGLYDADRCAFVGGLFMWLDGSEMHVIDMTCADMPQLQDATWFLPPDPMTRCAELYNVKCLLQGTALKRIGNRLFVVDDGGVHTMVLP